MRRGFEGHEPLQRGAGAMRGQVMRMRLQKPGEHRGSAEKGPGPDVGAVAGAVEAVDGGREIPRTRLVDDESPDGQPRALALHAEEGYLQRHLPPYVGVAVARIEPPERAHGV